jgi:hypothetical protein
LRGGYCHDPTSPHSKIPSRPHSTLPSTPGTPRCVSAMRLSSTARRPTFKHRYRIRKVADQAGAHATTGALLIHPREATRLNTSSLEALGCCPFRPTPRELSNRHKTLDPRPSDAVPSCRPATHSHERGCRSVNLKHDLSTSNTALTLGSTIRTTAVVLRPMPRRWLPDRAEYEAKGSTESTI